VSVIGGRNRPGVSSPAGGEEKRSPRYPGKRLGSVCPFSKKKERGRLSTVGRAG